MKNRKPRVLFVAPFGLTHHGTLPYRILPMMTALDQRDVRVRMLVADWDGEPSSHVRYTTLGKTARIDLFPLRQSLPGPLGILNAWKRMFQTIWHTAHTWHPDVIHLIKPIGVPFLFLAYRQLLRVIGKNKIHFPPMVLDCDDLESAWPQGGALGLLWKTAGRRLEEWAWKQADALSVASHYLLEKTQAVRGDDRVHLVSNIPMVIPEANNPLHSRRVLIPTRLVDIRPHVLAQWIEAIVEIVPEASILVVGPPQEKIHQVKKHLRAQTLSKHVAFLTWQPQDAFVRLMQRTRVGVYVVEDTPAARAKSPARLLSLMAAGVPVVATDVGESRYIVGDAGILTPPDATSVASSVAKLWRDPSRLLALSQAARRRIRQAFTIDELAQQLSALYTHVVEEPQHENKGA